MNRDDDKSINELELSVCADNALHNAGVLTIGALRKCDLKTVGLGAKRHQKAVAKALAEWDAAAPKRALDAKVRLEVAREAMKRCTEAEQAQIFRELARCACADIGKIAGASPGAAIGAVLGGIAGAILGAKK